MRLEDTYLLQKNRHQKELVMLITQHLLISQYDVLEICVDSTPPINKSLPIDDTFISNSASNGPTSLLSKTHIYGTPPDAYSFHLDDTMVPNSIYTYMFSSRSLLWIHICGIFLMTTYQL